MSDDRKPLVKVGALWKKESQSGGYVYLSGELEINGEKTRVMVFPVKTEWKKPNSPDFDIKVEEGAFGSEKKARARKAVPSTEVAAQPVNPFDPKNFRGQPKPQEAAPPLTKVEGLEEFGL